MSQYLLSFARSHLDGKSDGYLALLWCMYKANQERGRYSEHIKAYITSAHDQMLKMDFQRIGARFKKVLDGKPELDWVAPSGLSPLAYLQVKNFRGFGELSADDKGTHLRFSKMKNIFYAPNGGGKSSLCEALEFGTTGHIKEAERRKTKVKPYIARGRAKLSLSLIGRNNVPVTQSVAWSSCFIDRNRLQEFSLLGSKDTGSAESDIVATLFGLEELQEVISRFVRPESFNLTAFLRQEQTDSLNKIDVDRANLIEERHRLLANIAHINDQVCADLVISPDQQAVVRARFARLKKQVEKKIRMAERLKLAEAPAIDSLSRIERVGRIARYLLARKAKIEASFLRDAAAVNYRAIYKAIQALEQEEDACPACSTPLHKVTENPFKKARRELQALGGLDRLKKAQKLNDGRIIQIAADIAAGLAGVEKNARLGIPCPLRLKDLQTTVEQFQVASDRDTFAVQILHHFMDLLADDSTGIAAYLAVCSEGYEAVSQTADNVKRIEDEIAALQQKLDAIRGLFTDKTTYQQLFKAAGSKIAKLMEQRSILHNGSAETLRFNSLIRELQVEYGNLYRDLLQYKQSLEKVRIAGIETKAAEYYKAINNHDEEHEKIESILFEKVNESYRIRIANVDGTSQDAFSVLSEGHLRALGLSLLLAMAEKNKFPLIVFDDVVNAIDSDHRSNIIDLCFSDPYLKRTQMVVTTHDRLFWERFCIIAERHPQADLHSSCVLTYTNKGIVAVDHAGGFQGKVHEALRLYDVRQALIYCRIWFESIVVEYCLENALAVTAHFGKSQLKKNVYLQISLEKTFSLVEPLLAYDLKHFNLIKNDLVNWGGQNQEHHAFDEGSLNFVHSKTSKEVVRIYDAIRLLECQLFPKKKHETCAAFLEEVNRKIDEWVVRIGKLDKAPEHKQQEANQRLAILRKRGEELGEELAYIAVCLASNAEKNCKVYDRT